MRRVDDGGDGGDLAGRGVEGSGAEVIVGLGGPLDLVVEEVLPRGQNRDLVEVGDDLLAVVEDDVDALAGERLERLELCEGQRGPPSPSIKRSPRSPWPGDGLV